MNKFLLITIAVTFLAVIAGVFLFAKKDSSLANLPKPENYEFYVGDGCPHCENVEEFLSSWDKKDKITIETKEVRNNRVNAEIMLQREKDVCKLPTTSLAVPLLVTPQGECFSGDEPIISYFKSLEI